MVSNNLTNVAEQLRRNRSRITPIRPKYDLGEAVDRARRGIDDPSVGGAKKTKPEIHAQFAEQFFHSFWRQQHLIHVSDFILRGKNWNIYCQR